MEDMLFSWFSVSQYNAKMLIEFKVLLKRVH